MDHYKLSPSLKISRIITGLWQVADMEKNGQMLDVPQTAGYMNPYFDKGFSTFDMADHYGSSELIAGHFKKEINTEVQLLTKWVPKPGKLTRDEIRAGIEERLKRLNTDSIDLLQYHAWNYADASYLDQLVYLTDLKEEGLIKNIGVTNFDSAHLRMIVSAGVPVVSNQICYSLLDQRAASEMTKTCLELDIGILAFGTLAGGFFSEKWIGKPEPSIDELENWSLMKYKRFIDQAGGWVKFQALLSTLEEISSRTGWSVSQIAMSYILDQPAVAGIIIGARLGESEHVSDNLKTLEMNLSIADKLLIKDTLQNFSKIPGDCGDEYRVPPFLTASGDLSHHIDEMPTPFEVEKKGNVMKAFSRTTWETEFGYCRATRVGDRILVSGTTASHGDILIGKNDPSVQAHFVVDKIEGAILSLGGKLENVVRTRIYTSKVENWEVIAQVLGQRFRHIRPTNTLIQANLIGDEFLVEMEAEAIIG